MLIPLKKFIICLKVNISGIDTNAAPNTLTIYTRIGFRSIAIPIGIAPLSSVTGIIDKIIIFKYSKFASYNDLFIIITLSISQYFCIFDMLKILHPKL